MTILAFIVILLIELSLVPIGDHIVHKMLPIFIQITLVRFNFITTKAWYPLESVKFYANFLSAGTRALSSWRQSVKKLGVSAKIEFRWVHR